MVEVGEERRPGPGHPLGRSPFGAAAPSIVVALGYVLLLIVWLVLGDRLPGGRTFAVHLFTLGVLTNLVLTFSEHFARVVTRAQGERASWWPVVTNIGVAMVLVGLPGRQRWLLAIGATVLTWSVFAAYLRIRRARRGAIGARFAWIARVYERAHGAFTHGALLGALLGIGVLPGVLYSGARAAHLHANVLGWGGLTLLATLVFFGPTMARTRIEEGADGRSARALRHAATGLSVATVLLVFVGLGGVVSPLVRIGAALGLAVYGWATIVVCLPVGRAAWRAKPTAARPLVVATCVWFPVIVWLDVVVIATGQWRWFDALGVAAFTGVLAQAILATLVYLAPMLRGRSTTARERIRQRLEVGMRTRAVAFQVGALAWVAGATRAAGDLPLAGIGWAMLAVTVLATAVVAVWPCGSSEHAPRPGTGTT